MSAQVPPAAPLNGVLYVYYKVPVAEHAACLPKVQAFQAALLARWPGLQAELLQRPQASNGLETWMEIYRPNGQAAGLQSLTPELEAHIEQAAVAAGLPLPRHAERFVALR